jgi:hypothetical protein
MRQKAGRITAAAVTREVMFEPVQGSINDRIDDAYRAKYHTNEYLSPMINSRARAATVKIIPQEHLVSERFHAPTSRNLSNTSPISEARSQ